EVVVFVGAPDKDILAWKRLRVLAIGRAVVILPSRQETLDGLNLTSVDVGEFAKLNKPFPTQRLCRIFIVQVWKPVCKPRITRKHTPCGTFHRPLFAFKDGHRIHFAAGVKNARHSSDQGFTRHSAHVWSVWGVAIGM